MGLDCSHNAWDGAYSAFNSFRQVVCAAVGGSFPPHNYPGFGQGTITRDDLLGLSKPLDNNMVYFGDPEKSGEFEIDEGIIELLLHSDCDGVIPPEMCKKVADGLEEIIPKIAQMTGTPWSGHIEANGGYVAVTERFINGCREAYKNNEPLEFY